MSPTFRQDAGRVSSGIDRALDVAVLPGYTSIGRAVRSRLSGWPADPEPDALAGRHVVVTGTSSGLGAATVQGLVSLGAFVHCVVRDVRKGRKVVDEAGVGDSTEVHRCDLGDLNDVRALAAQLRNGAPLSAVVHNAGVMPAVWRESAQGHELSMAVHVLAPVLLTELLLPVLEQARIVVVTSGGMYAQRLRADDLEYHEPDYSPSTAYARSKRVQVELLPRLQERWGGTGNVVAAMHPGWADTPGVTDSLPAFGKVMGPLLRTAESGADTAVWLSATEPPPEPGKLWQDRAVRSTTWLGRNAATDADRATAWNWVAAATGLTA